MNLTKQQQLLSHIKRIVSTVIFELDHERFHDVVVTDVLLSNDTKQCRVIIVANEQQLKALNGPYLRTAQNLFRDSYERRTVPKLVFVGDDGTNDRIEELLHEANKSQTP